jgi:DNA polymerase III sliding clamp (beta) subunit (PCNA family)
MENTTDISDINTTQEPQTPPTPEPKQEPTPLPGWVSMKFADAKKIRQLFDILDVLTQEVTFTVTKDKILIQFMDPSRVAMLIISIPKEVCLDLQIKDAEEYKFALNVHDAIVRPLRKCEKDETLTITVPYENRKILFLLEKDYPRSFQQNMMEPSCEEVPVPKLVHSHSATMPIDKLIKVNEDVNAVSDHMRLIMNEKGVQFDASDDYYGNKASMLFVKENKELLQQYTYEGEASTLYSVTYLKQYLDTLSKIADQCTYSFKKDHPLEITAVTPLGVSKPAFSLKNYSKGKVEAVAVATVQFWLAPRIECGSG